MSWVLSCYLAIRVSGSLLTWRHRAPVKLAWTTPGLALVASLAASHSMNDAEVLGAHVLSALLMTGLGVTGAFERVTARISPVLANALLAGLALVSTTLASVTAALTEEQGREAAFLTLAVRRAGSRFWGSGTLSGGWCWAAG